jgi:hypothetical protein
LNKVMGAILWPVIIHAREFTSAASISAAGRSVFADRRIAWLTERGVQRVRRT